MTLVKNVIPFLVLVLLSPILEDSFAQQVPDLVELIPSNIASPPEITTPTVSNAAYVNINLDALNQPKMQLNIFGEIIEITREKINYRTDDEYRYKGIIEDGTVSIVVIDSMIRMEMRGIDKNYVITTINDTTHIIKKMDPTQYGNTWEIPPAINSEFNQMDDSFALQSTLQTNSRHIEIPQQIRDGEKITICTIAQG